MTLARRTAIAAIVASVACRSPTAAVTSPASNRTARDAAFVQQAPSLTRVTTPEGSIGVPRGWRAVASRNERSDQPRITLVPPGRDRRRIVVTAVAVQGQEEGDLDRWLLGFAELTAPAPADSLALARLTGAEAGCPEHEHCVIANEGLAAAQFYAAARHGHDDVVVAYVSTTDRSSFEELGGFQGLVEILSSARLEPPGTIR